MKGKYVSLPEASTDQIGREGKYRQIRLALDFKSCFRECLIAFGVRYVGGTRRLALFDHSNKKALMLSVSGQKYLELNLLDIWYLKHIYQLIFLPTVVLEY